MGKRDVKDINARIIVCDVVIEFLSVELAKYRAKKKNLKKELNECLALENDQKPN